MRHVAYDLSTWAIWTSWGLFALVWAVGAAHSRFRGGAVREQEKARLASVVAVATAVIAVKSPGRVWHPLEVASPWLRGVGIALLIPSTAAAIWARVALGSLWSGSVVAKEGQTLRTEGPYRVTRHPIYTAVIGMVVASAMCQGFGRWLLIIAGVLVVVVLKAKAEERLLLREFPDAYARYRRRVPQLIPLRRPAGAKR